MELSALIKAVLVPLENQAAGDALRDLKPGDRLTGKVLSIEGDGRALVDLGRSRVLAQISFAVKAGEPLNLQVVENGAVLRFRAECLPAAAAKTAVPCTDFYRVLMKSGQVYQFIQITDRLPAASDSSHPMEIMPRDILEAVSRVRASLEAGVLEQPTEKLAAWIKSAAEDRGVLFEKRLADMVSGTFSRSSSEAAPGRASPGALEELIAGDIKPQLLILKDYLDEVGNGQKTFPGLNPRESDVLRNCVNNLLDHVTRQQSHAVTRWEFGAPQQVLVHLLPFQELRTPVQIKFYYHPKKHGGNQDRQHRIAILLDMNRLGPVRVDLSMIEGNLHIGFFVASEVLKDYFQEKMAAVEAALSGKFQQLRLDVYVSREKIDKFHHEDQEATAMGGIDITA